MAESFLTVAQQVLVLFLLIGVGFLCGKTGILKEGAIKCCADLVLYIAVPCVIVQSFIRDYDPAMLRGLLLAGLAALLVHGIGIALAHLIFRDKEEARRRVLRFSTVFSNAGYMALPLQQACWGKPASFTARLTSRCLI